MPPIKGEVAGVASALPSTTRTKWWRILAAVPVLLIGVAAGFFVAHRPQPSAEIKQWRLTVNSQDDPIRGSVISPDGKYLAFADKTGFYLRQIENGETHPVSLPKGLNAVPAAWYPDGTHLIVTWIEGPKSPSSLWQISIMGGAPRRLADDGRSASISRDGLQVAFVRGKNPNEELWRMGANGEELQQLLAVPHRSELGVPAWSPTGQQLAFMVVSYPPAQWGTRRILKISTSVLDAKKWLSPHGQLDRN